jgi:hypothetical protein
MTLPLTAQLQIKHNETVEKSQIDLAAVQPINQARCNSSEGGGCGMARYKHIDMRRRKLLVQPEDFPPESTERSRARYLPPDRYHQSTHCLWSYTPLVMRYR